MSPDLALLSTLDGSNYPCLELIFMVPKVFEPLKFDCIYMEKIIMFKTVSKSHAVSKSHLIAANYVCLWKFMLEIYLQRDERDVQGISNKLSPSLMKK